MKTTITRIISAFIVSAALLLSANWVSPPIRAASLPAENPVSLPSLAAWVANTSDGTVSVIDLAALTEVARIDVGGNPTFLSSSPDGSKMYLVKRDTNSIAVVETTTGRILTTIAVGTGPGRLAVSRDGKRLYVPNEKSNNISVVDTVSNTVIATIPASSAPISIAQHPIRNEIWVGYGQTGTVLEVFSESNFAVLARLRSQNRLYGTGFAFRPDGSEVFASESCGFCGRFHLLSGDYTNGTLRVIRPDILWDNSGSATGCALHPISGTAYLAKYGQNGTPRVQEHGGAGRTVTFGGAHPNELTISKDGSLIFVVTFRAGQSAGSVSVVATKTFQSVSTIKVGNGASGIALVNYSGNNTVPTIAGPADVTIDCAPTEGATVALEARVTDPDSGQTLTVRVKENSRVLDTRMVNAPVNTEKVVFNAARFAPGEHAIDVEVSDGIAVAVSHATVRILKDNIPPTITCPAAIRAVAVSGTEMVVNYAPATASDNCSIPILTYSKSSGSSFPVGKTIVTCTATDAAGNTAKCSFSVTVVERFIDLQARWGG